MKISSNPSSEPVSIRQSLAAMLLQTAVLDKKSGLSAREIAGSLDVSHEMVHKSLSSLQVEGAIRIERHKMIINRTIIERIAAGTPDTGLAGITERRMVR